MGRQSKSRVLECKHCKRQFPTVQSLEDHNRDKHRERVAGFSPSYVKRNAFLFLTILVIVFASYNLISSTPATTIPIGDASRQVNIGYAAPPASFRAGAQFPTVYYFAFQCATCHKTNLAMEKIMSVYSGRLNFRVVDVTKDAETNILAARYGVQSVPVLILADKDGQALTTWVGEASYEQILGLINRYYGV